MSGAPMYILSSTPTPLLLKTTLVTPYFSEARRYWFSFICKRIQISNHKNQVSWTKAKHEKKDSFLYTSLDRKFNARISHLDFPPKVPP